MAEWRQGRQIDDNIVATSPADGARPLPPHWRTVSLVAAAVLAVVSLLGAANAVSSHPGPTRVVEDARPLPTGTGPAPSAAAPPPASAGGAPPTYTPPLDANGDVVFAASGRTPPTASHSALPTALMAVTSSGPVVTPPMASGIVDTMWKLRGDALGHPNPSILASFETGSALEVDTGRCGCDDGNPFGSIDDMTLFMPRQTAYPASFMAEVATTASGKPFIAFFILQRTSASSPWLLAFSGGFATDRAEVTPPAVDADGYLAAQTATPALDPKQAHTALATYWSEAKRTGTIPATTTFAPGPWTTDFAKIMDEHHQGDVNDGLRAYYSYQADPAHDPVFTFPEGQGWLIACSAVRVQKTFTGSRLGDGPQQDPARRNWGPGVTPGLHTAVVVTEITLPCIEIPPAAAHEGARVRGADEFSDTSNAIDVH